MFAILQKEINSFLNSLVGYVVLAVFLIGMGLLVWVFPEYSLLQYGYAGLDAFFLLTPFLYMFLIPAITMRTFAEEKRLGTMELLFTRPLTDLQIILGKYLAACVLVVLSLLPTLLYYYTIYQLGSPKGNIDTAAVVGSYVGLVLLGAVFSAIGVFASALTDNQIVSFIIAVFFCFIFYAGFSQIASINVWATYAYVIGQLGIDAHYNAVSKGLLDSRDILYFFSIIIIMLGATQVVLGSRKWE
jgi:ABC-2 type transport system permease protein